MKISYSAVQDWRRCQQSYAYRYIDNLESRLGQPAPELGRILHNYLQGFYLLYPSHGSAEAHTDALKNVRAEYTDEMTALGNTAYAVGEAGLAADLFGLVDKAVAIAERYYQARGADDIERHTPLMVEEPIEFPLDTGIVTPTRVDLVTRDSDGLVWLWEHKSLGQIPPQTRRMKDLQTTLMAALVHEAKGIEINGVVWNYLRTKPPTVPDVLKSGLLSMRKDLDSTWDTYLTEITRLGQDPIMYDEVRQRLEGRELTNYFVRIEQPLYQSENVLLRDFIASARTIKAVRESGVDFTPVRTVANHCDWCQWSKLCEAVITGGDDAELKTRLFKTRQRKEEAYVSIGTPDGDGTGDGWD